MSFTAVYCSDGLGKLGGRVIWHSAETLSWRRELGSSPPKGGSQGDDLENWSLLCALVT